MQTAELPGSLSEQEKKVFALLREVAEDHGVTVRVAGGWVRDRLLGQQMKQPDHAQYIQHEISSAVVADVMLRDLKAPNDVRKRVVKLVRHHMRLHLLSASSEKGVRKVLADIGYEDWRNLVEMSMADSMGKNRSELNPKYAKFDEYVQKFVKQTGGRSKVKPPLNGQEVMTLLGLTPGPKVGEVMRAFEEKLLEVPAMSKEEASSWLTATFQ